MNGTTCILKNFPSEYTALVRREISSQAIIAEIFVT